MPALISGFFKILQHFFQLRPTKNRNTESRFYIALGVKAFILFCELNRGGREIFTTSNQHTSSKHNKFFCLISFDGFFVNSLCHYFRIDIALFQFTPQQRKFLFLLHIFQHNFLLVCGW